MSNPDLLARCAQALGARGCGRRTVQAYTAALRRHLAWLAASPLAAGSDALDPTRPDPERARRWLLDRQAVGHHVDQDAAALRLLYVEVLGWPPQHLRLPTRSPRVRRPGPVPGQAEVLALVQALPRRRDQLLLLLIYAAGLRVGQVVALRVADLDPVAGTLARPGGRPVRLPPALAAELAARARGRPLSAPLLPARHGGPLSTRAVQKLLLQARARRGPGGPTTQDLRRAFAAHLLQQGVDLRLVQAALGHRRPGTTRRLVPAVGPAALPSPLPAVPQLQAQRAPSAPCEAKQPTVHRSPAVLAVTSWL
ncbi:tyrosine-type recombinase/integrase [Myxococcota bacterium]|nr:tyrosine-type recombinase/integrase [Myxococcota bacterium]